MQEISTRSGSRYELDLVGGRIRRLAGTHDPTPRQGPDGEWRCYESVSDVAVGQPLVVVWRTGDDGVAECTITSAVDAVASLN